MKTNQQLRKEAQQARWRAAYERQQSNPEAVERESQKAVFRSPSHRERRKLNWMKLEAVYCDLQEKVRAGAITPEAARNQMEARLTRAQKMRMRFFVA